MQEFVKKVRILQWDDHRYYHQCRINQTLHLVSAISFLTAYVLLFINPAAAGIVGWVVGMVTRQSGHIFFEPRGFDKINNATDEHKEAIKAGYNMRRKAVLISIWVSLPVLLYVSPSLFGLIQPAVDFNGYVNDVGLVWLALGAAGLLLRTLHLSCWTRFTTWRATGIPRWPCCAGSATTRLKRHITTLKQRIRQSDQRKRCIAADPPLARVR